MGNRASGLGCLGKGRHRTRAGPEARGGPSPPATPQGPPPPGISWACWGPWAVEVTEVTEVTETVVTEMVATEAVEVSPGPLDTLRSWLDGMEELQASQAPLAPDVTVAAAQLREQELLRRLLGERALQVERVLQEAQSPVELRAQWDRLVQRAEARCGILEQLVPAAWSFKEACRALLVRLTPGKQPLTQLGLGQAGPEGREGAIGHLQDGCEGAVTCAEGLDRALEAGRRLLELLAEDEAQLVREQLEKLQELARLTGDAVCAQRALLCGLGTVSTEPSPPASLGARLELAGAASECQALKDQEQLRAQLAGLAERLEQLAQWAEAPYQVVAHTVSVREPHLPLGAPGPAELTAVGTGDQSQDMGSGAPAAFWSETQEDTGLKATRGPAELTWRGLVEPAASEEGLQPEGAWDRALQAPRAALSGPACVMSPLLRRSPVPGGRTTCERTCHLGLLLKPLGHWAVLASPSMERPCVLEGAVMLTCVEDLFALPHRLTEAELCRMKGAGAAGSRAIRTRTRAGHLQPAQSWTHERDPGPASLTSPSHSEWLAHTRILWPGGPACDVSATGGSCSGAHAGPRATASTATFPGRTSWTVSWHLGSLQASSSHTVWPMWGTRTERSPQMSAGQPSILGASVSRSSLMVRVGGGWVALDEYLVKNDPGRAKGRTSQKIHERFLSWTVVPSRPSPKVTSSILRAPSHLLPRKTGHRNPSSSRSRLRRGTGKGTPQDSLAQPTQD
ncbi:uncharacterized protein [Desmodus rotundus]|uniref:uncharacterized protein isoform X2 n=1 Tax=Desmodus rotundus TaxID=9430 RepID=UPI00238145C6|nr:uncharacterized protein LOC123477851 isoform X2 [Desmodus rotundus]